ncbi:tRNA-guanine transglycosylase DpdA [Anaeromyxobacter paludicola]|uniref:tRNA-guanine(15) transglycosylase-like domain-containing protein n=1 Tax=Anaeromyxobacter paludicola TaxID=2918171 RepID=A0ABN6N611_9BACT|nr:tRNA-guanine transglycosylase DpdA [Anaeromyxobacter paludicola]BDG08618.1 hypothetical protein AMPC_17310 [Anaeromyxobacter paludicola]
MKFFFPDSQDLVDPGFDFEKERWSEARIRQRDDRYAHEIFRKRAFDGLLVSKGIVDGFGGVGSRYSLGQRNRLLRNGVREFFRLDNAPYDLPVMGDCGAFTYVKERVPPYTVDQVIQFYSDCQFDFGLSVDHVIFEFKSTWDADEAAVPPEIRERQAITLQLAREFLDRHRKSKPMFSAVGVAQGWSPNSYANAVKALQSMGYRYIAMGGMVPLKTPEILASLAAVAGVRKPSTKLHLLGVTRTEAIPRFASYGVASFDSTSPLRQAFKDDRDNYYTLDGAFTAIRIPQVEGNATLQKLVLSGAVDQAIARRLERACLAVMRDYEAGKAGVKDVVRVLMEYEHLARPHRSDSPVSKRRRSSTDNESAYREVLEVAPWRNCACEVCRQLGHHVILFRGAERNRRRGFHNLYVFYRRLQRELGRSAEAAA